MWTGITSGENENSLLKDSERQANHETVQFDFLGYSSGREGHVISEGEISLRVSAGGE